MSKITSMRIAMVMRRAYPDIPLGSGYTKAELHADEIARGVIVLHEDASAPADERFRCLVPSAESASLHTTIESFPTMEAAQLFCKGWCARRDYSDLFDVKGDTLIRGRDRRAIDELAEFLYADPEQFPSGADTCQALDQILRRVGRGPE